MDRKIPPIVSTDWLAENLNAPNLVIIDIRSQEEYLKGHIPNAVNVPFEIPESAWVVTKGGLMLELPPKESLFQTIGSIGIKRDSLIVVVGKIGSCPCPSGACPFPLADAGRVATTLLYAGLKNVAILDGAHETWADEGRPLTTNVVKPSPTVYEGVADDALIVSKEYVLNKVKSKDPKTVLIDSRDPDVYFGVTVEPFSPVPGHISGAKNLPAAWIWVENRKYRDTEALRAMVEAVVGDDKSTEIILYCGVGGYTFTWGFILKEVFGYTNVKLYDGSYEEWTTIEPRGPVTVYKWE
ncbi:MAG: rhodanese-like domain-containing protein [Candidatus Bathyarchaeia archaeon]